MRIKKRKKTENRLPEWENFDYKYKFRLKLSKKQNKDFLNCIRSIVTLRGFKSKCYKNISQTVGILILYKIQQFSKTNKQK